MARKREAGFFERLTYIIKGTEASVVELLATVGPWLAPLTPASMTYQHVVHTLGFSEVWGWTTAISVEILGLASGHTMAKFYLHNKRYRAQKDRLPVMPIIITFVFYLAVITTINLSLDWTQTIWAERIAKLGLILLSVPAIVIVSIRAQHATVLLEKEARHIEKKEKTVAPSRERETSNGHYSLDDLRAFIRENNLEPGDVGRGGVYSPKTVAKLLGTEPGTIRTGIHRLKNGG